jgi:hypothetical protein
VKKRSHDPKITTLDCLNSYFYTHSDTLNYSYNYQMYETLFYNQIASEATTIRSFSDTDMSYCLQGTSVNLYATA